MVKFKVFVETSVLLSASISYTAEDFGIELKHKFYDISKPLMGFLNNRLAKNIGITSPTVEIECKNVLAKAVMETLIETIKNQKITERKKRKEIFDSYVIITNSCADNLSKNIFILRRDPIPIKEKEKWFKKVSKLYAKKLKIKMEPEKYAKIMAKAAPKQYRKLAEKIYKAQREKEMKPIKKLKKRRIGDRDIEVLADAIYLKNLYGCAFLLASTDQDMSPVRLVGYEELSIIPDSLEKRFGIECNWPDNVLKRAIKLEKLPN